MDIIESPNLKQQQANNIERVLKRKCSIHPAMSAEFIYLNGESSNRFVCFRCIQSQGINASELLNIKEVLEADATTFLYAYPPVKDPNLLDQLSMMDCKKVYEEIEAVFIKYKNMIESAFQDAQRRAKSQFTQYQQKQPIVIQGYQQIAEIEKLQGLVVSQEEGADRQLDEFIKDKWNKADHNKQILQGLINQVSSEVRQFSFEEPNQIVQEIIQNIYKISFFESQPVSILKQVNLTKSTYGESDQLVVSKVDNNNSIVIKQISPSNRWNQIFLNPILDPSKKYIANIELEEKNNLVHNHFVFGLVPDQIKDDTTAYLSKICYDDRFGSFGVTKQIKGNMWARNRIQKRNFEVRIHLNQKYLSVASLPDYESIVELDDPNKINPQVPYRLFFGIAYPEDTITLSKLETVKHFNNNFT